MMGPPMMNSNAGMPFSVCDILQPSDADASMSYKRSIEMAHALASSSVYSTPRSSTSGTHPSFGSSSAHNSYYVPSSSMALSPPNNQYYDYGSSLPNGQYPSNPSWYGSAASTCHARSSPLSHRSVCL